jgi:hypothetical protein
MDNGGGPARNGFLVHNRACLSVIVVERTVSSPAQTSDLRSRKSEYPRVSHPVLQGLFEGGVTVKTAWAHGGPRGAHLMDS